MKTANKTLRLQWESKRHKQRLHVEYERHEKAISRILSVTFKEAMDKYDELARN